MKCAYWEQIATVLERVIKSLESDTCSSNRGVCLTHFDSANVPAISLKDYLARIDMYSGYSDSCFVLAFAYIDRLLQNNPGFILTKYNSHRIVLSAVVLAINYSEDNYFDNAVFARIGGISLPELNLLEIYTLLLLRHELYVDSELYFLYTQELQLQNMKKEV
eukprot:TRINITY_DN1417_c0_g1_i7.p1 TRINITY_DN1417_c0_g1~~TRINITY_DN1417_c0_g1_i7.p1  ORF type:complete len:163 (-),score=12.33 TRINITY_DN1417_c0_g1_i7:179-667(-)